MPTLSLDFSFLEKFKYPPLAALCGILVGLALGYYGTSTTLSHINEREVKELHRQVDALEAANTTKGAEITQLREQVSMLTPQRREAETKRRRELEAFIRGVDKEIAERKTILWRPKPWVRPECDPRRENCPPVRAEDPPLSDIEKRYERELDALYVQRHEARRKLIELLAQ